MAPSSRSRRDHNSGLKQSQIRSQKPQQQQATISHLFSSPHSKRGPPDSSPTSDSKRHKLDEKSAQSSPFASIHDMYNFSKPNGSAADGVIDLTTNSPPTPKHRRISSTSTPMKPAVLPGSPHFGAKRLVVKNLRTTPRSDPNEYCNKTRVTLDGALTAIFANESPVQSNEELYRGVENICKLGQAKELAALLGRRMKEHVAGPVREGLASKADGKNIDVLSAVVDAWTAWNKQMTTVRAIFFYLDRSHLLQTQSPSIHDSAVNYFRVHVFGHSSLAGKSVDGACDLLLADRMGTSPNTALFKAAVSMFHDLAVYTTDFEPKMLGVSQKYIADWSDRECADRELPDYVTECDKLISAEMERCRVFDLVDTTRRDILTLLEHHLVERKEADLTDRDAIADLLDTDNMSGLSQVYQLLQRRRLGTKLKVPFAAWIDLTGTAIIFDEKGQDQMVVKLLELKQKLDKVWRSAFEKNQQIGHTLREAFEAFINKSKKTSATWGTDNSKPGEMIAKYVDQLLRSGAKAIPQNLATSTVTPRLGAMASAEEENDENAAIDEDSIVDAQLDQVLDLFRFVHGKAVFEAFYKKDLARRLLMGRSASNDAEKSMLSRLKTECGSSFTHNLEQMFRDIEIADGEMKGYRERLEANDRRPAVDLTVNILSASAWPTYPDVPVIIPQEISKTIAGFEQYYSVKHTGRKLAWKHALAHCVVKASFPKAPKKELVVSAFQAVVLLLFNNVSKDGRLSYSHIKGETGLSEAEVKRTLQSLACAKVRPLTKYPKGREIDDNDSFSINENFTHDKFRVKVNAIQLKETVEENKETHERVSADRQYETQAAIVRIMKSRKTIGHQELIAETIKATKSRGQLQPADIKRNIDKLIDKEYMERIEGNKYSYLA